MSSINRFIGSDTPFKVAIYETASKNGEGLLPTHLSCNVCLTVNLNLITLLHRRCIQGSVHPKFKLSITEKEAIDAEINDFLGKRIIERRQSETEETSSNIPNNKKGTLCLQFYFHLKSLNQAVTYRKSLESAIRLMKRGCFMSPIGQRNAYYSIPTSLSFRKYLTFAWRDLLFQFCAQ